MRSHLIAGLAAAYALCGAVPTAFAGGFEGHVHYKTTMKDRNGDIDEYVKGSKMRTEVAITKDKTSTVIMDMDKMTVDSLMDKQKMYMEMPIPKPKDLAAAKVDMVLTGKTQTILGYSCEQLLAKSENGDTEIWGAKGLGSFPMMGQQGRGEIPAWAMDLQKRGFFPMKMTTKSKDGVSTYMMEATRVEKKSLDASLFVPPADYKKFQMPDLGGAGGDMMKKLMQMKMNGQ